MYLVVYGHAPCGPDRPHRRAAELLRAKWRMGAAMGTGFLAAAISSVMNNMPTVLVGALSINPRPPSAP
ncbi:ArsB/NhaD family transporter [Variovorax boronicumulans]|uniref:ArsB/NhaD family transporter n=1 Tax=Variovorax boronicumulans TaxID=436515 RepID=UPI0027D85F92|nr:ArsB/NhaD family transporter [Variovorax boronicumulans]